MTALALAIILATAPVGELEGRASWYATPGMTAAAGPALRQWLGKDWRGSTVRVCARSCVVVTLTDWCQCYRGESRERLIDLSDAAFAQLAPLPVGLVRVTITEPGAVNVKPPATDAVSGFRSRWERGIA